MIVSIPFKDEAVEKALRDDSGVRHIQTWACTCGCELKAFYGWGDARGMQGRPPKMPVMWVSPGAVFVEVSSLDQVEQAIDKSGIPMPMLGITAEREIESVAQRVIGAGHKPDALARAIRALFPKTVRA